MKIILDKRFICPLTQQTMKNPVTAADGQDYEYRAIALWLTRNDSSPFTSEPLQHKKLIVNAKLQDEINHTLKALEQVHGEYYVAATPEALFAVAKNKEIKSHIAYLEHEVNACDDHGETPLQVAVCNQNIDFVKILLDENMHIDVNHQDLKGFCALHCAVLRRDETMTDCLLQYGASMNLSDADGNTPLMHAIKAKNMQAIHLLLEYGAKINTKNNQNETALDLAITFNLFDIAQKMTSVTKTGKEEMPDNLETLQEELLQKEKTIALLAQQNNKIEHELKNLYGALLHLQDVVDEKHNPKEKESIEKKDNQLENKKQAESNHSKSKTSLDIVLFYKKFRHLTSFKSRKHSHQTIEMPELPSEQCEHTLQIKQ